MIKLKDELDKEENFKDKVHRNFSEIKQWFHHRDYRELPPVEKRKKEL